MKCSFNILSRLALGLCLSFHASTSLGDALSDMESAGRAALEQRNFDKALQLFEQSLTQARKISDKPRIANQLFYLGLTLQRSADPTNGPAAEKLAQAAKCYRDALELRSDSAGTLNNLAQVYSMQGTDDLALGTLKLAIALPDPRQSVYTLNYADLLLKTGRWKEACRFYALAAWAQPDDEALHQKLVDLCLSKDHELLLTVLWEMVEHGQVLQAQSHALQVVNRASWNANQKDELLALVAVCLSKQHYEPMSFGRSNAAGQLTKLSDNSAIGPGAQQLILLHQGERLKPSDYSWWSNRIRIDRPAPRGVWPGEGFQQLCRSLAERCRTDKERRELVERYLRLAATLNSQAPDPEALIQLADLYAGTDRLGELAEMMRHYENAIFMAKGELIRTGQTKRLYDFHTALGVIYSHMGRLGDSGSVGSAVFQLEHALNLTRPRPGDPGFQPVDLSPKLVNLLADVYWKTNEPAKAVGLQLESSQRLINVQDPASALQVLHHLETHPAAARLSGEQKLELQRLKINVQNGPAPDRPGSGKTPAAVRFEGQAFSVLDASDRRKLDEVEVHALEGLVKDVIQREPSKGARPNQYQMLPAAAESLNVKDVVFDGKQGRVLVERNAKTFSVPFTVESAAAQKIATTRYVNP